MAITAVIFDLDGVLIDSADAHHQSWRLLAAELGQQVEPEQFAASFGRQNRDIVPLLFGADLDQGEVRRLGNRKEALYRGLVRGRIPAIPGAAQLVRRCEEWGLKLAIGSSAPAQNIDLALGELGIADCFDAIVHDGDVTRGKPDPDVFLAAAQRLAVDPSQCVVIEDAPSGIRAARAAGMKAIGLTTYHPAERLTDAHLVVERLGDLRRDTIVSVC